MKKIIVALTFLCACAATGIHSQTIDPGNEKTIGISFDSIKVAAQQPEVYDALLDRFLRMDSTLTMTECAIVYYGWAFQPQYRGSHDILLSPARKLVDEEKYEEAWNKGVDYLDYYPLSLYTLEALTVAAYNLRLSGEYVHPLAWRYFMVFDIIEASGDGKTPQTAFKVISINDEYVFMVKRLRATKFNRTGMVGDCDVFDIKASNYSGREVYFDASLPLRNVKLDNKDEQESGGEQED